jgi:hypothetical protein
MPCGKPREVNDITMARGKVPSHVTLCDNCPNAFLSKRTLSDIQLISSDEGVSTRAQDWYVEHQQQ